MFWVRLRSSIILMAITIGSIVLGGDVLFCVLAAVSLIGLTELYKVMGMQLTVPGFIGYGASLFLYRQVYMGGGYGYLVLLVVFFLLLMTSYVFSFPRYSSEQITLVFFGLFYVSWMLSFIYQVRMVQDGAFLVWLIFIGSWGSDTCAYCVGMLIGKHRLPGRLKELSPKKSVEGCIGGIAGAALIGLLYGAVCRTHLTELSDPVIGCALLGGASSVISQIGDLAASAIKRNHKIKDYGRLIPGHGGILDRFDAVIFTAPIVYLLINVLA